MLMQAITQNRYGAPAEVLQLTQVEKPTTVPEDSVLIRVHATSVAKGDWHLISGRPYIVRMMFGLRRPTKPIPGQEVAGTVEAVGAGVTRFAVGDAVFGEIDGGAFAEYACAKAAHLVHKPANVSFEEAAATGGSATTSLQGLREEAKLQPGQHVLINGAGGGVGSFAVQIAKAMGATVTAVCSGRKADAVRALGADHIIDYTTDAVLAGGQRFDVMLDLVGNYTPRQCRRVIKRRGVYVASAGGNGKWIAPMPRMLWIMLTNPFVSQRMTLMMPLADKQPQLTTLAGMLERGEIKPLISRSCTLADIPDAVREQGEGHMLGKAVATIVPHD